MHIKAAKFSQIIPAKPAISKQISDDRICKGRTYLSDTQLRKLRRYIKDKADLARMCAGSRGVIDELIMELLVNTGLRTLNLCNLNISDLPVKHGKDCIWVRDGKGKASRMVDISERLKKRLERFVKLYRKRARA